MFLTLLNRIVALIGAQADIIALSATVQLGRIPAVPETSLPFIAVYLIGDATVGEFGPQNTSFIDWDVAVAIEILVDADATEVNLEPDYLALREGVHNAIMADAPTLSLAFIEMAYPIGADEASLSSEGKRKTANYRTQWMFRMRTAIDDIS